MMNSSPSTGNPFATRYTRPGALRFRFAKGESEARIVEELRRQQWWGQIVGPHGSGKSTLLATLMPEMEAAGRQVRWVALRADDRRWPLDADAWRQFTSATQLIVDGYEQLTPWRRWLLTGRCRKHGNGLLVTTHRDLGLPTLYTTNPRLDLAIEVARELLPGGDTTISDGDIEAAWRANPGNVREMLFDLYDLFERRRPP
jgi:hypothetical protein